jgi:hypothetical protein
LGAALQADGDTGVTEVTGPKHQKEKRSMEHFGLDVSVNETSICIVDDAGRIIREVKVASELGGLRRRY